MGDDAPRRGKMPTFETREDAPAFWDEHDTTEFEDEWEPVEIEVARPLRHSLTVSFASDEFRRLLAEARLRGLGPAALVHAWVTEALAQTDVKRDHAPVPIGPAVRD